MQQQLCSYWLSPDWPKHHQREMIVWSWSSPCGENIAQKFSSSGKSIRSVLTTCEKICIKFCQVVKVIVQFQQQQQQQQQLVKQLSSKFNAIDVDSTESNCKNSENSLIGQVVKSLRPAHGGLSSNPNKKKFWGTARIWRGDRGYTHM